MSSVAEQAATVKFDAAWISAVTRASALAQAKLPEPLHGRIQRATALVLHGKVVFEDCGHVAQVESSKGDQWYVVNGHCMCEDYERAPEHLCKHRLAKALYRRASDLLREPITLDLDAPEPLSSAAPLPEAPASVNVRLCIQGREVQWTLRDVDEARLAERLAALLARYPVAETPAAPASGQGAQPTPEGWCIIHQCQMKQQSNQRGSWWSHKASDGSWCKGK